MCIYIREETGRPRVCWNPTGDPSLAAPLPKEGQHLHHLGHHCFLRARTAAAAAFTRNLAHWGYTRVYLVSYLHNQNACVCVYNICIYTHVHCVKPSNNGHYHHSSWLQLFLSESSLPSYDLQIVASCPQDWVDLFHPLSSEVSMFDLLWMEEILHQLDAISSY